VFSLPEPTWYQVFTVTIGAEWSSWTMTTRPLARVSTVAGTDSACAASGGARRRVRSMDRMVGRGSSAGGWMQGWGEERREKREDCHPERSAPQGRGVEGSAPPDHADVQIPPLRPLRGLR